MKTLKCILAELVLPFIVSWFFMTVLVDIVTVPTVFRNSSSLLEAGKIGMTVFHSFNCMEIFLGSFVLLGLLSHKSKSKLFLATSILLLLNAFFYTFFMTPMIANISIHMHQIAATDPQYEVLRHQHAFYHNLYRYFDMTKLLVLLVLSGLMVRLTIKHKECA